MRQPANFRDLGGLAAADGRKVKGKKILRSAEPNHLSKEDRKALLEDYELKTIIDLRSALEREQRPNDELPVETVSLDVLREDEKKAAAAQSMLKFDTVEDVHALMRELYRNFITEAGPRACYRSFVEVFLQQEAGAVLFHCFAGKDRTGMGAAVLLTLLGVAEEDIMADYLHSNMMREEANKVILAQRLAAGMPPEKASAFAVAMQVDRSYLAGTFDEAKKQFGSFYDYCTQGLGVTEQEVALLRKKYLE
jgi:Protein tyrosine/serine phosphatase